MNLIKRIFRTKLNNKRDTKVKIVAIAKNEAAYLAEWIYHHLFVGVDLIEIYYNRCTDNTSELVAFFSGENRVKFLNANPIFDQSSCNPQLKVYRNSLELSKKEGFTHVLYIDIDEFLFIKDFSLSIKQLVERLPEFDCLSLQWANKCDTSKLFDVAISKEMKVSYVDHVKSIVSTSVKAESVNIHTAACKGTKHILSNGTIFPKKNGNHNLLDKNAVSFESLPAFIIHRMYRSPIEYVALLGRGRPSGQHYREGRDTLKSNRHGYPNERRFNYSIKVDGERFDEYSSYMIEKIEESSLKSVTERGRKQVIESFNHVLSIIKNYDINEYQQVERILKGIDLDEVIASKEYLRNRVLASAQ